MQSNNIFYETGEIDYDHLSPYERFQLEKYGNILCQNPRPIPFSELSEEDDGQENDFQNHIYSHLNPAQ